jgi:FkbH-like protein
MREVVDPSTFLAGLELSVRVFAPSPADLPRLAQLVAKTNQFTLDGRRQSEAELNSIATTPHSAVRLFSATDRFGEYGTVGAVIVHNNGSVDTFVLSCRAMGRGVEEAMVAVAGELAAEFQQELSVVVGNGPKNVPAKTFFAGLGVTAWETPTTLRATNGWPTHVRRIEGTQN